MQFFFTLSIPFGFKVKFFSISKNRIKAFILFKNKVYSFVLFNNFFIICGFKSLVFCTPRGISRDYTFFFLIQLVLRGFLRNWKLGITLYSPDKFQLSRLLAVLKLLRLPDNYKGMGVQLFKDVILIKKREKFGVF